VESDTLTTATNHGKQWTGPELEILARDDLTHRDASLLLGRSFYAVVTMRHKLRRGEPIPVYLAGVNVHT
jgi:hypothetical protein